MPARGTASTTLTVVVLFVSLLAGTAIGLVINFYRSYQSSIDRAYSDLAEQHEVVEFAKEFVHNTPEPWVLEDAWHFGGTTTFDMSLSPTTAAALPAHWDELESVLPKIGPNTVVHTTSIVDSQRMTIVGIDRQRWEQLAPVLAEIPPAESIYIPMYYEEVFVCPPAEVDPAFRSHLAGLAEQHDIAIQLNPKACSHA
ncbi:hypothetical protein WG936_10200 [Corynebacterium sp. H127]|uniref:hypothetical protein n=1 Tax=Corynebacterium sp. H127 TaxID=3133418 RepID=UPI0030961108